MYEFYLIFATNKYETFVIMIDNSDILTSQYVHINQTSASLGSRFLAQLIDTIILIVYEAAMGYTLLGFLQVTSLVFLFFILLCPYFFYSLLCEIFNNGQSIGKMILKIRVVKVDGSMPTLGAYLLRWLLYPVDSLFMGGLGIFSILFSRHQQRLGDLAAGTMVVSEKDYHSIQVSLDEYDFLTKNYHPIYPQVSDLSLEQINVIQKTVMATASRDYAKHIDVLANKVAESLGIMPKESTNKNFLDRVIRDYQYYAIEEI